MNRDALIDRLADDVDLLVGALRDPARDASVAACPGWSVVDLGWHVGQVHRWATQALTTGAQPPGWPDDVEVDTDSAPDWVRVGGDALVAALRATDPDAATWHPFPAPRRAGVWVRRQAHETSVHRWDAEHAIGHAATIDPLVAADGIDEYLTVALPRLLVRRKLAPPTSAVTVGATDADCRWHVAAASPRDALDPAAPPWERPVLTVAAQSTAPSGASIAGTAADVLLRLWGRPVAAEALQLEGDPAVADAWLALGGM